MAKPYQSKDFCKAIKCFVQTQSKSEPQGANLYCMNHCKAYQFEIWLKQQGYSIVKFPTPFAEENKHE